jgi:hypothetical protein
VTTCCLLPAACCLLPAACCLLPAACRRNESVRDSKGCLREDSAGATTRRAFTGLLGVGAAVAKQWWDRGLRWGCLLAVCWWLYTWWRAALDSCERVSGDSIACASLCINAHSPNPPHAFLLPC